MAGYRGFRKLVGCSAAVIATSALALSATAQDGSAEQRQENAARQQDGQATKDGKRSNDKDKKEDKKSEAKQSLKVFKLKNVEPQQMVQLLRLIEQPSQSVAAGYRGVPGGIPAGGIPGAEGQPQGGQQDQKPLLIAADNKAKTLFVRGDEDRLEEVQELVDALDGDSKSFEKVSIGDAHLIPVKNANHSEVTTILQQLQLSATAQQIGDKAVVVLRGDDEELRSQAEQVINALDEQGDASGENAESKGSDNQRQQGDQRRQRQQGQQGEQRQQNNQGNSGESANRD